ncbi:DUF6899 family protein [Rhodopseudomonas palustris]
MPYIADGRRAAMARGDQPQTPGELNYALTRLLHEYIGTVGESYRGFNDALGALEGAKLEFYHRHVVPYEDGKRAQNDDIPFPIYTLNDPRKAETE